MLKTIVMVSSGIIDDQHTHIQVKPPHSESCKALWTTIPSKKARTIFLKFIKIDFFTLGDTDEQQCLETWADGPGWYTTQAKEKHLLLLSEVSEAKNLFTLNGLNPDYVAVSSTDCSYTGL